MERVSLHRCKMTRTVGDGNSEVCMPRKARVHYEAAIGEGEGEAFRVDIESEKP